jgi:lipoate-protein ligase A
MHYLDLTLSRPADNLALDEALLIQAEAGQSGEVLRLWEWPAPVVVLGAGCRLAEEVEEAACQADGVPVLRRASGGGTVLWGRGCLLYSLVLSQQRHPALADVRASYRHILERVAEAVGLSGITVAGISDLALGGRKFSGNAQQRKRLYLLHHGTLLYAFDLEAVARYLRPPPRPPDYRASREHGQFLLNLPAPAEDLKERLRQTWGADEGIAPWSEDTVRQLCVEKYDRDEWTRRR